MTNSKKLKLLWQNPEYRKRQSEAHTGKTGENSSHWKGGKEAFINRHRVQKAEYLKLWRIKNKERYRATANAWRKKDYQNNPDKYLEECKKWQLNNKIKVLSYKKKNKIKRRGFGFISSKAIQMVYEDNIKKHGTLTCYLCLLPIEFGQDSLEHKTPLTRGGTNEYNNLDVSHRSCNSKKCNKTEKEYRAYVDDDDKYSPGYRQLQAH